MECIQCSISGDQPLKKAGPTVMMNMDHNRGMNLGESNIGALASGK